MMMMNDDIDSLPSRAGQVERELYRVQGEVGRRDGRTGGGGAFARQGKVSCHRGGGAWSQYLMGLLQCHFRRDVRH